MSLSQEILFVQIWVTPVCTTGMYHWVTPVCATESFAYKTVCSVATHCLCLTTAGFRCWYFLLYPQGDTYFIYEDFPLTLPILYKS